MYNRNQTSLLDYQDIIQTQQDKLFYLLADGCPHTIQEITTMGISQYNARIKELRDGNNMVQGQGVICDIDYFENDGRWYKVMPSWRYKN